MADIKISELAETTDLNGLYTIGTDKNNSSKKVALQFIKDAADYANTQGDYAKEAADNLTSNLGLSEYPEFSETVQYSRGDIVRYSGKLYRFVQTHAAGAWVGTDTVRTSINAEVENALAEFDDRLVKVESSGGGGGTGGGSSSGTSASYPIVREENDLAALNLPVGSLASVANVEEEGKAISELANNEQVYELSCKFPENPNLSTSSSAKFTAKNLEIIIGTDGNDVIASYVRNGVATSNYVIASYEDEVTAVNQGYLEDLEATVKNAEGGIYYAGLISGSVSILDQFFVAIKPQGAADAYIKEAHSWTRLMKETDEAEGPDLSDYVTKTELENTVNSINEEIKNKVDAEYVNNAIAGVGTQLIAQEGSIIPNALPDTCYVITADSPGAVTISAFASSQKVVAKYTFMFRGATSLSLPSNVLWANGEEPSIDSAMNYELSIVSTRFGDTTIYKAILAAF